MKGDEFPLQLDDSLDSNNYVNLMCNVRFVDDEKIIESFLFCKAQVLMFKTSSRHEIQYINENNLKWMKCVGIWTEACRELTEGPTTENNFFWTCVNPKKGFASKYLAYRDVKCTKPHTIAENLILPAAESNI